MALKRRSGLEVMKGAGAKTPALFNLLVETWPVPTIGSYLEVAGDLASQLKVGSAPPAVVIAPYSKDALDSLLLSMSLKGVRNLIVDGEITSVSPQGVDLLVLRTSDEFKKTLLATKPVAHSRLIMRSFALWDEASVIQQESVFTPDMTSYRELIDLLFDACPGPGTYSPAHISQIDDQAKAVARHNGAVTATKDPRTMMASRLIPSAARKAFANVIVHKSKRS